MPGAGTAHGFPAAGGDTGGADGPTAGQALVGAPGASLGGMEGAMRGGTMTTAVPQLGQFGSVGPIIDPQSVHLIGGDLAIDGDAGGRPSSRLRR